MTIAVDLGRKATKPTKLAPQTVQTLMICRLMWHLIRVLGGISSGSALFAKVSVYWYPEKERINCLFKFNIYFPVNNFSVILVHFPWQNQYLALMIKCHAQGDNITPIVGFKPVTF